MTVHGASPLAQPILSYLLAVGDFVLPHAALLWHWDAPGDTQGGGAAVLEPHLGGLWAEDGERGVRRQEGVKGGETECQLPRPPALQVLP